MCQTGECALAYINECGGPHVYITNIDIIHLLISPLTLPAEIMFMLESVHPFCKIISCLVRYFPSHDNIVSTIFNSHILCCDSRKRGLEEWI